MQSEWILPALTIHYLGASDGYLLTAAFTHCWVCCQNLLHLSVSLTSSTSERLSTTWTSTISIRQKWLHACLAVPEQIAVHRVITTSENSSSHKELLVRVTSSQNMLWQLLLPIVSRNVWMTTWQIWTTHKALLHMSIINKYKYKSAQAKLFTRKASCRISYLLPDAATPGNSPVQISTKVNLCLILYESQGSLLYLVHISCRNCDMWTSWNL